MSSRKKKQPGSSIDAPVIEPRRPGAPSKLDATTRKTLLDEIAAGASYADAAVLAGIDVSTFNRWRQKGADPQGDPEYRAFCAELDAARVRRRRWYRTTVAKMSIEKKDHRGIAWLASVTEPEEFSPKIHVVVEQQFSEAIARLKEEYADEPELLERTIAALIGANASSRIRGDSESQSATVDGASLSADTAQAIAAAVGVPESDV